MSKSIERLFAARCHPRPFRDCHVRAGGVTGDSGLFEEQDPNGAEYVPFVGTWKHSYLACRARLAKERELLDAVHRKRLALPEFGEVTLAEAHTVQRQIESGTSVQGEVSVFSTPFSPNEGTCTVVQYYLMYFRRQKAK